MMTMLSMVTERRDTEEGFSLLELIVTISIIGILTAIAIPVFSGIQEDARQSAVDASASNGHSTMASALTRDASADASTLDRADTTSDEIELSLVSSDGGDLNALCVRADWFDTDTYAIAGEGCDREEFEPVEPPNDEDENEGSNIVEVGDMPGDYTYEVVVVQWDTSSAVWNNWGASSIQAEIVDMNDEVVGDITEWSETSEGYQLTTWEADDSLEEGTYTLVITDNEGTVNNTDFTHEVTGDDKNDGGLVPPPDDDGDSTPPDDDEGDNPEPEGLLTEDGVDFDSYTTESRFSVRVPGSRNVDYDGDVSLKVERSDGTVIQEIVDDDFDAMFGVGVVGHRVELREEWNTFGEWADMKRFHYQITVEYDGNTYTEYVSGDDIVLKAYDRWGEATWHMASILFDIETLEFVPFITSDWTGQSYNGNWAHCQIGNAWGELCPNQIKVEHRANQSWDDKYHDDYLSIPVGRGANEWD